MLSILAAAAIASQDMALRNGDRVVFYGDSITEQRLYTTYVETFIRTRYPRLNVEFFNAGIGGDSTWGGWTGAPEERINRDVKPYNPTVVTIMLGMNDGGYVPYEPKIFAVFQEWYGKLLGWMKAAVPGARITLLNSPPYDDWAHPNTDFKGYSETVKRFGEYVPKLAQEKGLGYVEVNAPLTEFIQAVVKQDPKKAAQIVPDAIHPGPSGHLLIAAQLLTSWKVSPVVSDVVIDFKSKSILKSDNTKVEALSGLSWTQTDSALPYPVGADVALGAEHLRFSETFNRQMLTVKGLEPGTYQLKIDGEKVAEKAEAAWAQGVNLAALKTPMRTQADKVAELTIKRNDAYFAKTRNVEFGLKGYASTASAAKALGALMKEIGIQQRKAAQPKPHRFELVKV